MTLCSSTPRARGSTTPHAPTAYGARTPGCTDDSGSGERFVLTAATRDQADARDRIRRLLETTISPELERIRAALREQPAQTDAVRSGLGRLCDAIADEHARLDIEQRVDRERAATLPETADAED